MVIFMVLTSPNIKSQSSEWTGTYTRDLKEMEKTFVFKFWSCHLSLQHYGFNPLYYSWPSYVFIHSCSQSFIYFLITEYQPLVGHCAITSHYWRGRCP